MLLPLHLAHRTGLEHKAEIYIPHTDPGWKAEFSGNADALCSGLNDGSQKSVLTLPGRREFRDRGQTLESGRNALSQTTEQKIGPELYKSVLDISCPAHRVEFSPFHPAY